MAAARRPGAPRRGQQRIGRGRPAHRGRSRARIGSHRLRARASGRRCARRPLPDHRRRRTSTSQPGTSPKPRGTHPRSAARRQSLGNCRRQAMTQSPGPTRSRDPRNDRARHRTCAARTLVWSPRSQAPRRVGGPVRRSPVTPLPSVSHRALPSAAAPAVDGAPPFRGAGGATRGALPWSISIASVSSPDSLDFYGAELRAHHEHLRAAYGISTGDEVVDIGCGTGLTTREAARAAAPGRVVGVDVSERMLERARQLTAAERLDNVQYALGDAQVHRFDPAGFDVAISRFGTMFFSDPAAAFANIAAALRPEARLVLLVWQRREHNEWARAIDAALGDAAQPPPPGADPFSLGDAEATAGILRRAGFDDMRFLDVHEPVLYGHDLDAALAVIRGFQNV